MQGDIFATKGIEYLVVIAYLIMLVGLLWLLQPLRIARLFGMKPQTAAPARKPWFVLADGYRFHPGHTWAAIEEGEVVTVGMDDFAGKFVGVPDRVELPAVGRRVRQGEPAWNVIVDGRPISMVSPVEGKVLAVNEAVQREPGVAIEQPYRDGWMLKVRVTDWRNNARNLLEGRLAVAWMRDAIEQLRQMPAGELGVLMPDGGMPVVGFGRHLDPEHWDEIARQFFLSD
jgi:glycine cleavage system H lipoate-binding protein